MNIKTNHCIESLICTFPDFYTFPVSTVLLYHNSLYLISYRLYLNSSTSTAQQGTRSTSTRYSLYPLQLYLNSSTSYSLYLNQLLALPQQLNKMTIQTIKLWLLWLILFKGYPRLPSGFPQGYPQGYPLCPSDWLCVSQVVVEGCLAVSPLPQPTCPDLYHHNSLWKFREPFLLSSLPNSPSMTLDVLTLHASLLCV